MKLTKFILFAICTLFVFSAKAQVKVGADGAVHATGNYPAAISRELLSNVYRVRTVTDRNNIPASFRDTGMIVHVTTGNVNYQLQNGITNSDWVSISVTPSLLTTIQSDSNLVLSFSGDNTIALLNPLQIRADWTGKLADDRITSAARWNSYNLDSVVQKGNWTTDSINIKQGANNVVSIYKQMGGPLAFGSIRLNNTSNSSYSVLGSTGFSFNNGTVFNSIENNPSAVNGGSITVPDTSGNIAVGVKANGTTYMAGTNGITDIGKVATRDYYRAGLGLHSQYATSGADTVWQNFNIGGSLSRYVVHDVSMGIRDDFNDSLLYTNTLKLGDDNFGFVTVGNYGEQAGKYAAIKAGISGFLDEGLVSLNATMVGEEGESASYRGASHSISMGNISGILRFKTESDSGSVFMKLHPKNDFNLGFEYGSDYRLFDISDGEWYPKLYVNKNVTGVTTNFLVDGDINMSGADKYAWLKNTHVSGSFGQLGQGFSTYNSHPSIANLSSYTFFNGNIQAYVEKWNALYDTAYYQKVTADLGTNGLPQLTISNSKLHYVGEEMDEVATLNSYLKMNDSATMVNNFHIKDAPLITSAVGYNVGLINTSTGKVATIHPDSLGGSGGATGWSLTGNAGTTAGTNFIGTTDLNDFIIKSNNTQVGKFSTTRTHLGNVAGQGATNAIYSFFAGQESGKDAIEAAFSNFIGHFSGSGATNAYGSNFIGSQAGLNATNSNNSIFIGESAGENADSADFSTLIGTNAGISFVGNNIGSNNIIMGNYISLPNSTENAINLGGVLFGTGTYNTFSGNPSITAQSGGRIGIAVVTPDSTLHIKGGLRYEHPTAGAGKVLTSDATGGASWQAVTKSNDSVYIGGNLAYVDSFQYRKMYEYLNEFTNLIGTAATGNDLGSFSGGGGTTITAVATGAANRVGALKFNTGSTSSTARVGISFPSLTYQLGGGEWNVETDIRVTDLSTSGERYSIFTGFNDLTTINPVDGIFFLYDEGGVATGSAASANWQIATVSNSTRTYQTTSVPVAANTWVNLRFKVSADGTLVTFYINDTSVGTSSTNIPTGAGRETGFVSMIAKSVGLGSATYDIDYINIKSYYTTTK